MAGAALAALGCDAGWLTGWVVAQAARMDDAAITESSRNDDMWDSVKPGSAAR